MPTRVGTWLRTTAPSPTPIAAQRAAATAAPIDRASPPPEELATFCLHAVAGASSLPSKAAVRRLVTVTLAGLRPNI